MTKRQQKKLEREELTKTQVLNLLELEKVAKYERQTSKKPALILGILGVLFLISGFVYNPLVAAIKDIYQEEPLVAHRETKDKITNIKCTYDYKDLTANGTSQLNINLSLENNRLFNYVKTLKVKPVTGQESILNDIKTKYKAFEVNKIKGYNILTVTKDNNLETVVMIDLEQLDLTTFPEDYQKDPVTRIEFSIGDSLEIIQTKAKALGYACK